MELCLYHPELGYYSRPKEQFGRAGDFYTSSDVHAVFGRLLARQFDEMWRVLGAPHRIALVELGPGRGLFAQDVLDWAQKKFPDFLDAIEYVLIERSPALRARLQERFAVRGAKVSLTGSLEEWIDGPENAIVFANEFFDALPVEVIAAEGQLRVAVRGDRFVETFVPASAEELDFLDRYGVHPGPGVRSEAALAAVACMTRAASKLTRGFIVAIDYGCTQEELLAGRSGNTVRSFRQHALSATPYEAPGEQDITANVNFTALRAAALASGMEAGHLVTQAQFLLGIGEDNEFADAFEDARLPQERAKITLQLKHLATPAGMGEIFQVLALSRGVDREKTVSLAGLRYARR
jgi:SAM-dependent MidA family methyltransferase